MQEAKLKLFAKSTSAIGVFSQCMRHEIMPQKDFGAQSAGRVFSANPLIVLMLGIPVCCNVSWGKLD